MLVDFSFANFRSINDLRILSMEAVNNIADNPKDNIFKIDDKKLLKSAVIYGANSSGKSNVIRALAQMKRIVLNSVKLNSDDPLDYDPFRLSTQEDEPSHFEVTIICDNNKYRYGFELTSERIEEEWLFVSKIKGKTEKKLFYRNLDEIEINDKLFPEGKVYQMVNLNLDKNRLFVSLCAQLGGEESKKIISWFRNKINILSGIKTHDLKQYSANILKNNLTGCDEAKMFFKRLQLGFKDIECVEFEFDESKLPDSIPFEVKDKIIKKYSGKKAINMYSIHNVYDENGNVVDTTEFDFDDAESEGTNKLVQLSGPIFDTLNNGRVLVIDELDAKLHPHISYQIVSLFNSPTINIKGAQLIFTTHDTHLLSAHLFRRDQIWFTEKDQKEQTDLYNMMDIVLPDNTKPRNDSNFEKNYIAGRYGAIPYIINE